MCLFCVGFFLLLSHPPNSPEWFFHSSSRSSNCSVVFLPSSLQHAQETGAAVPRSQSHLRVRGEKTGSQEVLKIMEARADWPRGNARNTHIYFRVRRKRGTAHLSLVLRSFQMSPFLFVSFACVFCPFPVWCAGSSFCVLQPPLLHFCKGQWPLRCQFLLLLRSMYFPCVQTKPPVNYKQHYKLSFSVMPVLSLLPINSLIASIIFSFLQQGHEKNTKTHSVDTHK